MGRRIKTGMKVILTHGPARGATGIVIDDYNGRTVKWDAATIEIPEGFTSRESESVLTPFYGGTYGTGSET